MASEGDIIEMSLVATFDGTDRVENVFQFEMGPPSSTDDADMLDDLLEIAAAIVAIIRAIATSLTVWQEIRARNITTGQVFGTIALTTPTAGNASGEPGATQVAQLLTMPTGFSRVVLRKYLGPLAEGHIGASGFTSGAAQTVAANLAAYLLPTISATNANWVYGTWRDAEQVLRRPSSFSASDVPATQRRRRRGVGI